MKISKKTRLKIVLDGHATEQIVNQPLTKAERNAALNGDNVPRTYASDRATSDHEHTGT